MNKHNEIFSQNLISLREKTGYSQTDLAKELNISRQAIVLYEKGQMLPRMDIVFKLSETLNTSVENFFKESGLQEDIFKAIQKSDYRYKHQIDERTLESIKQIASDRLQMYLKLERIMDSKMEFENPIEHIEIKSKEDAEKAAIILRKKWDLGLNPIPSVTSMLEDKGIKVIEIEVDKSFSGLCGKMDKINFIVINSATEESTRKRFTLLHELAHIVLSICSTIIESSDKVEKICEAFASSFLLPRECLVKELGKKRNNLNWDELLILKEKYGISVAAILLSMLFAGIVDNNQYNTYKESRMPNTTYIANENAVRYNQLLYRGILENKIDKTKALEFLRFNISKDFDSIYERIK